MGEKKLTCLCFPFFRYGQREWKNKTDCWGTTALFCDLTNETLELYEPYYGRVMTAWAGSYSAWSRTPRFTPWWESEFQLVSCFSFSASGCWDPYYPLDGTLRTTQAALFIILIWQPWKSGAEVQSKHQFPAYRETFHLLTPIHLETTIISLFIPKVCYLTYPVPLTYSPRNLYFPRHL